MEDILRRIEIWKEEETAGRKKAVPLELLKEKPGYKRICISLSEKLKVMSNPQFIAEFKRQSPSKGMIRKAADPVKICKSYQEAGAAGISVLTDEKFFGALPADFERAREVIGLPMLRKDFILEEYQVHETKAMGADVMLLIASLLSPGKVIQLASLARHLGMDVLLELHSEDETDRICREVSIIGVNNRNLRNFEVRLDRTKEFALKLPREIPSIAESGLDDHESVARLFLAGFKGFLIGEYFMRSDDPGARCNEFINRTNEVLK